MAMLKLKDIVNGTSLYGWVCRQCGTVIDSLIDTHRQWHLEPRATWAYMARASC
jgi:transcription initiation factor TFIIIB Brf1 subunit/transcription initiation factor TFIIB